MATATARKRIRDSKQRAQRHTEALFIGLQYAAEDYIDSGATETSTVYRLLGNKPESLQ